MKDQFLRWVFKKYRSHFYGFFVEETIGSLPMKVSEPALTFLANGKDKLTRWGHYWIHLIQQRIVTDKKDIEVQTGMILMLKIFLNLVNKQSAPKVETKGEPSESKPDHVADVEAAIRGYREGKK